MRSVLVTGGTGFLGRSLVTTLREGGVRCFATTRSPSAVSEVPGVEYIHCDLASSDCILQLRPYVAMVDTIIHAAALIPGRMNVSEDFSSYVASNLLATANLIDAVSNNLSSRRSPLESIVFTSTADVYGIAQQPPICEDAPLAPSTPYAVTKSCAEQLLRLFQQSSRIPITILRLSHVYGPGEAVIKAIPRFMERISNNEQPVIRGEGKDGRDYVYVEDVVEAILNAAEKRTAGTFNISSGQGHTIAEVAELIIEISRKDLSPIFQESLQQATTLVFSNQRAMERLDWRPRISLRKGLMRQWTYVAREVRK